MMINMKKNLLLSLFLTGLLFTSLCSATDEEPILVRLGVENQLIPIRIEQLANENSGFDRAYLDQLEKVMHFDFDYNGKTRIVENKNSGAAFIIQGRVSNHKLAVKIVTAQNQLVTSLDGVDVTGRLDNDRRQIHRVSDSIHKALFKVDGIASTRILYTLKTKGANNKWFSEVCEADYDGANAQQITHNGGYCVTPLYIPPKAGFKTGSILYVSYKTGEPKIYVASLQDGIGQRLSTVPGNQLAPAISKQRDQVVFVCDAVGNPDLFHVNFSADKGAIGKASQIFAWKRSTQGTPTFSPDGKQIAFVSNKDGSPKIYIMSIPKPGVASKDVKTQLITKYNSESSAPSWSPDGTKIAYCSKTNGVRQIWVYDMIKKEERQVTSGGGNKENPAWAPNSLHIVFNSTGIEKSELYLINLNQSKAVKISSGSGEKRFPNWEPRG